MVYPLCYVLYSEYCIVWYGVAWCMVCCTPVLWSIVYGTVRSVAYRKVLSGLYFVIRSTLVLVVCKVYYLYDTVLGVSVYEVNA